MRKIGVVIAGVALVAASTASYAFTQYRFWLICGQPAQCVGQPNIPQPWKPTLAACNQIRAQAAALNPPGTRWTVTPCSTF